MNNIYIYIFSITISLCAAMVSIFKKPHGFLKRVLGSDAEIFKMLFDHVTLSLDSCTIVYRMLTEKLSDDEIAKLTNEVVILEKSADRIAEEALKRLARSSLTVSLVPDLYYIVNKTDDIEDHLYFIAMELLRGVKSGIRSNTHIIEIYRELGRTLVLTRSGLERLQKMLEKGLGDTEFLEKLEKEIDIIEDQVDVEKNHILDKIYSQHKLLSPLEFTHLIELVRTIDDIADATEDIAHTIGRMIYAMKI